MTDIRKAGIIAMDILWNSKLSHFNQLNTNNM